MARRNHADRPLPAAAASIQQRGRICTADDVLALARIAQRPLRRGADPERIAARLDDAAVDFLLWSRSDDRATAGEAAKWARGFEAHAAAILHAFDMSPDPGAPPVRAEALALLFEALPPGAATREDVRRDLEAVRRLHALACAAAGACEARKGKPREPDGPLLGLFVSITIAYLHTVGGRLGKSDVALGAPFVRFAQAALRVMAQRLPQATDYDPERDTGALYALRSCVNSQDSVRHRYRAMRAARKKRAPKPGMAEPV